MHSLWSTSSKSCTLSNSTIGYYQLTSHGSEFKRLFCFSFSVYWSRPSSVQVTNEVLMVLVGMGVSMLVVPFRYLLGMFILDQFTCELKFRENSVRQFFTYLRDWWNTIPAAPVELLPPESSDTGDSKSEQQNSPTRAEAVMQAMSEWLGEDSQLSQLTGGSSWCLYLFPDHDRKWRCKIVISFRVEMMAFPARQEIVNRAGAELFRAF